MLVVNCFGATGGETLAGRLENLIWFLVAGNGSPYLGLVIGLLYFHYWVYLQHFNHGLAIA
jgi:hypothetical protein